MVFMDVILNCMCYGRKGLYTVKLFQWFKWFCCTWVWFLKTFTGMFQSLYCFPCEANDYQNPGYWGNLLR